MKKQVICTNLLIILTLTLCLISNVAATNMEIEATTENELSSNNLSKNTEVQEDILINNILQNTNTNSNAELKKIASTHRTNYRILAATGIAVINIVIITGLIVWWYKTNY